jgi:hypothetical protein
MLYGALKTVLTAFSEPLGTVQARGLACRACRSLAGTATRSSYVCRAHDNGDDHGDRDVIWLCQRLPVAGAAAIVVGFENLSYYRRRAALHDVKRGALLAPPPTMISWPAL